MSKKRRPVDEEYSPPPKVLDDYPFYGLELTDPEQIAYKNALWDPEKRFIAVDACAGSGKTTIAVAVAYLCVTHNIYDEVYYIRTPSSEGRIGFLPGEQKSKERPYMQPLYSALCNIGVNPITAINDDSFVNQKNGTGMFTTMTDVYMLGSDYKRKFIIIDEAQCMTIEQLKAIITRAHDDCKVVCCGSTLQIQGIKPKDSGFVRCIEHFREKEWAQICTLTKNYRGEMSAWADKM